MYSRMESLLLLGPATGIKMAVKPAFLCMILFSGCVSSAPIKTKEQHMKKANQNVIVQNATKADEGLYMVTSYLYETCLAQINVTVVLDSTSPVSLTSSSVTPKTPSPASSRPLKKFP
ncbi:UNVERIFIED_CONTAM: hypothetical protein K2H54_060056 [Gekko kuhli]